jgi:hypothetical protein
VEVIADIDEASWLIRVVDLNERERVRINTKRQINLGYTVKYMIVLGLFLDTKVLKRT